MNSLPYIICPSCQQHISIDSYLTHTLEHHPFFFHVWATYSFPAFANLTSDIDAPESDDYEFLSELCELIGNHEEGVKDFLATTEALDSNHVLKCPICLEDTKDNRKIKACGHEFCTQCIQKWLGSHKTCPICKQDAQIVSGSMLPSDSAPPSAQPAPSAPSSPANTM